VSCEASVATPLISYSVERDSVLRLIVLSQTLSCSTPASHIGLRGASTLLFLVCISKLRDTVSASPSHHLELMRSPDSRVAVMHVFQRVTLFTGLAQSQCNVLNHGCAKGSGGWESLHWSQVTPASPPALFIPHHHACYCPHISS
jgi:hypothetical protein